MAQQMMRKVRSTGPLDADIMAIGEAPGEVEERFGYVFAGPSGEELNRLFAHAGIARRKVRIRNVLDFRPEGNRDPLPAEIEAARPGLWAEIARVKPKVIITIGRFATHEFLPPYPMEYCQGLVFKHERGFKVYPVFHPAYALRKPSIFVPLYEAFAKLKAVRNGKVEPWKAGSAGRYRPMRANDCLASPALALDTEGTPERPWGLSWSSAPGEGYAVRAGDVHNIGRVQALIDQAKTIYLHESLGDLETLASLGITVPPSKITDSLILAFLLGATAGSQTEGESRIDRKALGLKILGFRLAGLLLRTFKEVMAPLDADALRAWIDHRLTRKTDPKFAKALARAYASADPRASLARSKFTKDLEIPALTIPWCDEMIQYACMDADTTRRIAPMLAARVQDAGLGPTAELDHGVIPLVSMMQAHGLLTDTKRLLAIQSDMLQAEEMIEARIGTHAWEHFNPRAHEQVEHLLFDWLDLPPVKYSRKTGRRSTDEKVMARLAHPVVDDLLRLRQLQKLRGTYVEALL